MSIKTNAHLLILFLVASFSVLPGCSFKHREAILKSPTDFEFPNQVYITNGQQDTNDYYHLIQPEDELAITDLQDMSILIPKERLRNDLRTESYAIFKVSASGYINLPLIGGLKVTGLNREQAATLIGSRYQEKELKHPIIDVRINNLYVIALGEVAKPGKYLVGREDLELIDLLGEAGGLTAFANKRMLKIIRGDRANPTVINVNLENYEFLKNPAMKLRSRDIVYVEPRNSAAKAQHVQAWAPLFQIGFVALNTILLIINLSR
jgi:polysaccharide export outer membrane protein